jgi:hypothetical protein
MIARAETRRAQGTPRRGTKAPAWPFPLLEVRVMIEERLSPGAIGGAHSSGKSMGRCYFLWGNPAACLLVLAALLFFYMAGVADAGKPPPTPPPPEGGVIYYHMVDDTYWRMNTDGSQKTLIFSNMPRRSEPSEHLHGGSRWFLTVLPREGERYPNGAVRKELFAVSEGGATVQLSDDPTLEPVWEGPPTDFATEGLIRVHPRWTLDDGRVSYQARRWGVNPNTGAQDVVEVGLYAIDLLCDVARQPPPVAVAPYRVPISISQEQHGGYACPSGLGMDWSPDGSKVAYIYQGAAFVADLEAGTTGQLPLTPMSTNLFQALRWSPDGSSLLLDDGHSYLETCAPNGSGFKVVATSDRKTSPGAGYWSPNSASIVFYREIVNIMRPGHFADPPELDVVRASASGGGEANLTGDIGGVVFPMGWRAAQ